MANFISELAHQEKINLKHNIFIFFIQSDVNDLQIFTVQTNVQSDYYAFHSELAPTCSGADPCSLVAQFAQIRYKVQDTARGTMPIVGKQMIVEQETIWQEVICKQ